jgi:RHH-type proline utilization regulon transcriptional repressor/proline dehydrogenase/delta 1-pyrroline-5-carboxylate dehydrogenase
MIEVLERLNNDPSGDPRERVLLVSRSGLGTALARIIGRGGEPLIRKGVDMAMRLMGEQFVTGETIEQALEHTKARGARGFRYSYDMLGEPAMTATDAAA